MVLKVKLERVAKGIKQYEFAALLGYNPRLWNEVEFGRKQPPEDVAQKAAEVLGKPVEELFRPA